MLIQEWKKALIVSFRSSLLTRSHYCMLTTICGLPAYARCSYDDGSPSGLAPSMVENASSQSIESTYKAVARSLLWGLYLIFPVSIKSVLHSISKKGMLIEDIRGQAEIYNNHGQVTTYPAISGCTVNIVSCDGERIG